jgi:hypothetical protein
MVQRHRRQFEGRQRRKQPARGFAQKHHQSNHDDERQYIPASREFAQEYRCFEEAFHALILAGQLTN